MDDRQSERLITSAMRLALAARTYKAAAYALAGGVTVLFFVGQIAWWVALLVIAFGALAAIINRWDEWTKQKNL